MAVNFEEMVAALAKDGESIIRDLTPLKAHLLHAVVGISGEAGELLDAIKKHVIYNRELDIQNVIEELGDIEFYAEMLRSKLNLTREEIIEANIKKLSKRYGNGNYSNQAAIARADKVEDDLPV